LYITGTIKEESLSNLPENPMQAKSYLEMILSSYKKLTLPQFESELLEKRVEVNEIDEVEDVFKTCEDFVGDVDEENAEKIKEYFDFQYPHRTATETIFKNSVSSINESGKPSKGQFVFEGESDFIEQGNAYHLALKEIDFEKVNSIDDVRQALSEIQDEGVKKFVDCNLLYNNITLLKQTLSCCNKVFKEQQFTSLVSLKDVFEEGEEEEIMLQGIVDLFALGEKNVLIDYKFTSIKDENLLKNKYKKQLLLYKHAIENGFNIKVDEVYLLSIKNNLLIKF